MRTNVKVVLKHFDVSMNPAKGTTPTTAAAPATPTPAAPQPARDDTHFMDSPGAYADTNTAPIAPSTDAK